MNSLDHATLLHSSCSHLLSSKFGSIFAADLSDRKFVLSNVVDDLQRMEQDQF